MHEVDLGKYQLRTDLIIESIKDKSIVKEYEKDGIKVEKIVLNEDNQFNKKSGNYLTISFKDITDSYNFDCVFNVLVDEIKKMLKDEQITKDKTCLVVGLGNKKATPDALGSMVISDIIVTRHLYLLNDYDPKYRNVSCFMPGVMADTGMETSDIVTSLVDKIKPDFLIVIDSLCASSIERINCTIQMTNTGIHPGSGISNSRKEISKETVGIPVIAIGVPTVVDSVVIVNDTINFLMKKISYLKDNHNLLDKFKPVNKIDYLKSDNTLSNDEKTKLLGYLGILSDDEKKSLIYEVLSPINNNMIVTVKEIDYIMDKLSKLLAKAINHGLHEI